MNGNGSYREREPEEHPQSPKTVPDEKIERHFNGIIFGVLGVLALGLLIAIWFIHHRAQKIVPPVTQKQSSQVRP